MVVSIDDGETWESVYTLEDANGKQGVEYVQPAVIHTSDNMVHVAYAVDRKTIKHAVLDPEQF